MRLLSLHVRADTCHVSRSCFSGGPEGRALSAPGVRAPAGALLARKALAAVAGGAARPAAAAGRHQSRHVLRRRQRHVHRHGARGPAGCAARAVIEDYFHADASLWRGTYCHPLYEERQMGVQAARVKTWVALSM